jgi:hypothetical protein
MVLEVAPRLAAVRAVKTADEAAMAVLVALDGATGVLENVEERLHQIESLHAMVNGRARVERDRDDGLAG